MLVLVGLLGGAADDLDDGAAAAGASENKAETPDFGVVAIAAGFCEGTLRTSGSSLRKMLDCPPGGARRC